MKITNVKYKGLNLANEDERGENLLIDFTLSSIFGITIALPAFENLTIAFLIYFVMRFTYYFSFEYFFGRTPGKYQTQTKVVNRNGLKPSPAQLITRNLSRFISLPSGISDNERAIHDIMSNTFVVKNNELKKVKKKQPFIRFSDLLLRVVQLATIAFLLYDRAQSKLATMDIVLIIFLALAFVYILVQWCKKIQPLDNAK